MGAQRIKRMTGRRRVERALHRRHYREWVLKAVEERVERQRCGRKRCDVVIAFLCRSAAVTIPRR